MMPGNIWKSKVDHLGASIDRCRERIDEMVQEENYQRSNKVSRMTEQYKGQVYNNGSGTTVEVSIKTKKPSTRSDESRKPATKLNLERNRDTNWDTLLSQDDRSDIFSPSKYKQNINEKPKMKEGLVSKTTLPQKKTKLSRSSGKRHVKEPVDSKRFSQKTKSSVAKEKEHDKDLGNTRNKQICNTKTYHETENVSDAPNLLDKEDYVTSTLQNQKYINDGIRHEFPNRTLHIFLRELRSAVNSSGPDTTNIDVNKIIDDIEFVTANLTPPTTGATKDYIMQKQQTNTAIRSTIVSNEQTKNQSDTIIATQIIQEQVVRKLQMELEKSQKANNERGVTIQKLNKQSSGKDALICEKDEKINDMKAIVARLTGTNNDMLGILSTKVRLEESLKALETANMKLMKDLENAKRRNGDLDALNLRNKKEIAQLQNIVNNLRKSMNLHVEDVGNVIEKNLVMSKVGTQRNVNSKELSNRAIDSTFATVDLELSSNHSSAGNSPLPTDPPNINLPNVRQEEFDRMLPIHSISESILADQGTLTFREDKDEDGDSAIGNSESHTIVPGISSNTRFRNKEQFLGNPSPIDVSTNNAKIDSHGQNIQTQHNTRPSLGEKIQELHKLSQEQKLKQDNEATKGHDKDMLKVFTPTTLNLSETADSQRLDASAAIERDQSLGLQQLLQAQQVKNASYQYDENIERTTQRNIETNRRQQYKDNLPPIHHHVASTNFGSGDKRASDENLSKNRLAPNKGNHIESEENSRRNTKKLEDQRKSKEEINRLKLHREQQTALLLEKQLESAEQNKKMAEDYLIANQIKASSHNVHERVHNFLSRMKNDDKFQISLSSQADLDATDQVPKQPSSIQMNFTGTTHAGEDGDDSRSLTESRFRQGLEDSLEYSAISDT